MARTVYPDETRAAVIAALLQGQSISSVAREYNIPKGTVASWKHRNAEPYANVATEKTEAIGELLILYLSTAIEALIAQAVHFKNIEWLTKQSAENAAVLHGVMTDKAIRLLEALSRSEADE